jgi:uncharacterized protein
MLALLFGAISLLYSTVGQAGGTSFLALMAFASFSPNEMRPTALMLNIVASAYSTWLFNRGKFVEWVKLTPLLVSSMPTALVGGLIILDERSYKTVTGLVLLVAAAVLALRKADDGETDRPTPLWGAITIGAAIGFVSAHRCWRRVISRPLADYVALGISKKDGCPFCAFHIRKFSRRPCGCRVRGATP